MKKLVIYSSPNSIHTKNLFEGLSTYWDTTLLLPSKNNSEDEKNKKFMSADQSASIRFDLDHSEKITKVLFKQPTRTFSDILRSRKQARSVLSMRRRANSVSKTLDEIKPDLLYAHQLDCSIISYMSEVKPYVLCFWGSDIYRVAMNFKYKSLLQEALNNAKLIHTINKEQKEILMNNFAIPEEKIFLQHFGADISNLKPIKDKSKLRDKYKIKEKFVIAHARYSADKDLHRLDILAKAFKILLDKNPNLDVRLLFMNKAYLDEELGSLIEDLGIKDKVTFTKFLVGDEYNEVLSLSDILVQIPKFDAIGVTVMEALAVGLPIVSTKVAGAEINVKDNFNGLFIKERTPEELAEKIAILLHDKQLYNKLSVNAREWAVKNCDRKTAMKNISEKLHTII
ncbi:MAG: glycosyltransferase [Candidatus Heimdallarchaeota archaeon]